MIYFGQVTGVISSLTLQFYIYGYFGPFLTITGFVIGCYLPYLLHLRAHQIDRNQDFRWGVSKKTATIWSVLFLIGYGFYIISQKSFEWEYLVILPILSTFLGLGSGMLTAIIGDSLQMIFEDHQGHHDM